jgi:hypothetical protein
MKYRSLTLDELKDLKEEFITFLSAHTIPAQDWEKIKAQEPQKAEKLIQLFSDAVFEKVLSKAEVLEFQMAGLWQYLSFGAEAVKMVGVLVENVPKDEILPLRNKQDFGQLQNKYPHASIKLLQGTKKYTKKREEEIFDWIKKGALLCKDPSIFEEMEQLLGQPS